ncbi:MAG: phosphoribosyltransferase family protein [Patescibacteria group bacterium]|nr:phosphoribosyltransferase family protein [Patescibacteria group bacterium]MDD5121481.1 phosphoribosyltransferase family protein [Patescibacteria group bacterium]MDD5221953.1 phosphoribosyltransferase family protein [Patescibacteria group bacterium]MDD5396357.1 phosphoribosyltransferase family protein [Patescibacteria group bacterium]
MEEIGPASDPLDILHAAGGYYACPRDPITGKRLGPLVGYAGRYEGSDGQKLQYVGDVYFNVATLEQDPNVLRQEAERLGFELRHGDFDSQFDVVIGAPMGGIVLAALVAMALRKRFAFLEKRVTALATGTSREQSELVLSRHDIGRDAPCLLVEDVCNNYSTTGQAAAAIGTTGARLVGVGCFLNRSGKMEWEKRPVVALVNKPTEQWKQDDPAVAADIAAGNVILKPKAEWPRLMEAMAKTRQ